MYSQVVLTPPATSVQSHVHWCVCVQLSSRSPKETTPTSNETSPNRELQGISEIRVHRDHDGDEVQEVEVSVQEEGKPDVETPVVLRLKKQASTGMCSPVARIPAWEALRNVAFSVSESIKIFS